MLIRDAEKTTSQLVLFGAPFATIFLLTNTVTDPVNATKLFATGGLGFALFSVVAASQLRASIKNFKLFWLFSTLFILAALNSVISSSGPLSQNLYGSYGRNTGFIAYLILALSGIGILGLRSKPGFQRLIFGLQIAGILNVLYCAWVLAFGDFLGWTNPYGNILGLFGNPDFVSAFLGIFVSTLLAFIADTKATWKYRIVASLVALIAFYEIVKSHAIQGVVVTTFGIAIVGFFFIRAHIKFIAATYLYVLAVFSLGILAVLGALQKGPFTFIYKTSVSLRGVYWHTGAVMGREHPFTGVGMDSYGDWFRRARSLKAATVFPGPNVISNASHNVIMDFFAYGGWPLLLTYLALVLIAAISVVRVIIRSRSYEPIFVAMTAAWACYVAQEIISINQIGLALWGWLLTGALVAYEFVTRNSSEESKTESVSKSRASRSSAGVISPQLVAGLSAVVGLLIAVPPLAADMKWRSAIDSRDANKVMAALTPSYLTPNDSQRLAQAVQILGTSNLLPQAHQVALQGIKFNPDYFDAWKMLYFLQNSTPAEKAQALENMKRLDPHNLDVTAQ